MDMVVKLIVKHMKGSMEYMSENKRFHRYFDCIHDEKTDERLPENIDVLIDKLNELLKENEQLRHDLELYEEDNTNEILNNLRIELTSRLNDCFEEYKI